MKIQSMGRLWYFLSMESIKNAYLVSLRQLRAINRTPSSFIVAGLFLVINGLFFSNIVDSGAGTNLSYLFRNEALVLMLILPAFTMSAIVLEKRNGTYEYLMTTRTSSLEFLGGKYCAYIIVAAILIFMTLQYPFWLNMFTNVDPGRVLAGTTGLFLFSLALISIGIFSSALTGNQITASFLAFFIALLLWCAESVFSLLTVRSRGYFRSVSLYERFLPFSLGLVDYSDGLFFLHVSILFIVLTWFFLYRGRGGSFRELALVLLIIVIVFFGQSLADRNLSRADLTAESLFTLSSPMVELLKEITEPLKIMVFMRSDDPARTDVDGILREMVTSNPLVTFSLIDPYVSSELARKLQVTKERTTVFSTGDRVVKSRGCNEVKLISGIRRLLRTTQKGVCFLTGHGEKDFLSVDNDGVRLFVESLAAAGLSVAPLRLDKIDSAIPEDCGSIVIIAPENDLLKREGQLLTDFVLNGGGLLIFAETTVGPVFASLLATYGIGFENAVVIEPQVNLRGLATEPIITDFRNHPAVRNLEGAVFRGARPLKLFSVKGMRKEALMYSSGNSWGETSLDATLPSFDEKDIPGPLLLGVAVERTIRWRNKAEEVTGRVLVVSDSHLPVNESFNDLSNGELVLGAVEWVTGYGENVIMLPKGFLCRDLYISSGQFRLLFFISVIGVPFLAFLWAFVVYIRFR